MLSLILPTYNEAQNLPELLPKVHAVLGGLPHEIIVVDDDSPDGTWKVAQELGKTMEDLHVIRRVGRRGLSSAVIEGFLAAKGDVFAVMDADGQHDMALLTQLTNAITSGADIAIGSRYVEGGSVGQWDERRFFLSRLATRMALGVCRVKVKDPMSGFFAIRRETFEAALPHLNPKGFKILLDLLVHVPADAKAMELPFTFATRMHGESKLSRRVQLEFLEYLYDVTVGKYIPLTFVKYCMVGALGVIVNLISYTALDRIISGVEAPTLFGFSLAVLGAIEISIFFNFCLNNWWTFAHTKLRGVAAVLGFLKYNVACGFGALANVAVSGFLYSRGFGELESVILGACAGMVWNYTMSRMFTWRD